ncbi:acetyl/propionyl/methylcrotonyl-CoA carboxylase subunit alpha [Cytobacillus sp. IB215316]|uniref:acetyl-CoA carboxylase biotin carboxylase subunit n=1 Tax=Cytobacillus sp. IB215316 TaxID=3097354 RepID=UPI002A1509D8|nr:biotin carboxylase N-terminal domain-containing protein [Cytobacillus sp. IB215316]MDX8359985.1 biotin carboxylase N-terminal domain-containing protein [Cytobacillus sp. IB215316]
MKKILIANRGEIASRVIRTCNNMGIETIAIYSDADKNLPYVNEATKAIRIGESPVQKSYMAMDAIVKLAVEENVDGIHPGYGFLSENAMFAKLVNDNGITFIGPQHDVIALMGEKIQARKEMQKAGVPIVPGSHESVSSVEEACVIADKIGYPVMIKASSGGGGVGMQRCNDEQELKKVVVSIKNRAKAYFGNDEIFIEKYVADARHIEIQICADTAGNIVHLFERDCSIQRRNQKVIEETPSPFLSEESRRAMIDCALKVAAHVGYTNVGTVEFVVDNDENFYFLEMNTRLQVEHPITEMVTGIDLVEWQIRLSCGENMPLLQHEINSNGHALEFRLYAEDPVTYLPSPGTLNVLTYPSTEGVRIDKGYDEGCQVTPFYDPMIAKLVIHGLDRNDVLHKAEKLFEEMKVEGIKNNLPLLEKVIQNEMFREGCYTTSFLSRQYSR